MIPLSRIQAAANQIAERFKPVKIILFGSYAYGTPNEDSDVDYMVLIKGSKAQADRIDIRADMSFGFPVDVLVRSVDDFEKRIAMEDYFLMDIKEKGKVLYEAAREGMGAKSRGRFRNGKARIAGKKVA